MPSSDLSPWIEHLKEPLILLGFVMMLFWGVLKILVEKGTVRISSKSIEQLMKQGLLYAFIIGIIVIIFGFSLAFKKANERKLIDQETKGEQSPAIVTKGNDSNVNLTYGISPKEENQKPSKAIKGGDKDAEADSSKSTRHIEQNSEGDQSPAIVSGGDVNITFEKK